MKQCPCAELMYIVLEEESPTPEQSHTQYKHDYAHPQWTHFILREQNPSLIVT